MTDAPLDTRAGNQRAVKRWAAFERARLDGSINALKRIDAEQPTRDHSAEIAILHTVLMNDIGTLTTEWLAMIESGAVPPIPNWSGEAE